MAAHVLVQSLPMNVPTLEQKIKAAISLLVLFVIVAVGTTFAFKFSEATHAHEDRVKVCEEDIAQLVNAIESYQREYNRFPAGATSEADAIESRGRIMAILMGEDPVQNEKKIRFWKPGPLREKAGEMKKTASGDWELRDPWEGFYRVHLDVDGDRRIGNPGRGHPDVGDDPLWTQVIVYSAGPDGETKTWVGNVRSW
jgi:hypothetical protein